MAIVGHWTLANTTANFMKSSIQFIVVQSNHAVTDVAQSVHQTCMEHAQM